MTPPRDRDIPTQDTSTGDVAGAPEQQDLAPDTAVSADVPEPPALTTAPVTADPDESSEDDQVPLTELAEQAHAHWEKQWADQAARDENTTKETTE